MKKPLAIIFNDIHLKPGNEEAIIKGINHMLKYAVTNNIKDLIFAGDLFDSRSFQRQDILNTFDKILNLIHGAKCNLYAIPGNHDKTRYNSLDSFLDVYRFHPSVKFIRKVENIFIKGKKITLLPFFSDDMLVPMLNDAEGGDVLIGHFEMKGSTHLAKVIKDSKITRRVLKKWSKVYLGHYHNTHEITEDIVHLPSFIQASFGEDNNKGFTVLNEDLTYTIIKGKFKEFVKVVIDMDKTTLKELRELTQKHSNSKDTIRFEFIGSEAKLKAIDKSQFTGTEINVLIKYEKIFDISEVEMPEVVRKYDAIQINGIFKDFCNDKGYDYGVGKIFLDNYLKAKNEKR